MYENFSAPNTESLNSIFNRLQKIRNKPGLDTMRFDDLYNNFKIVEQEVKGTTSSSSSSNSQNMAFVSSPSNTNEVNTAYGVSTANTQVCHITINRSDIAGYDKSKVKCFNCHKMRHFIRECRGPRNQDSRNRNQDSSRRIINVEETFSKAMLAIDGAGFDWSYMADDEVPINMALMDFSDSERSSNSLCLKAMDLRLVRMLVKRLLMRLGKSLDAPMVEKLVLDDKPKAVNTTRPNSAVVNDVRANQVNVVKAPTCWVWRPTKLNRSSTNEDQGYVDSGCSRHMTWNMSYLLDFKEFDRGYVTFGGRAKGGKITSKGTLKTGFTKVSRKNNMYSVDMKNIVPRESLTCLVAKATLDESMLWHWRLGHGVINKLVKENLVRGLPLKCFENDQTCAACLKGMQHKASCIKREFSVARTPQQNCVAKRRNKTLIEAVRTTLTNSKLPTTFWAEAVNTACYVQNRVLVVKPHNKTPYKLFRGRTPALSFMRPFGCHVTILNTLDYLGKFDGKSDEGFFIGYSLNSKSFRVYNIRTRKVEESLHIRFLEDKPIIAGDGPKWLFDIDVLTKLMNYVPVVAGTNSNDSVGTEESVGTGHSSKETGSSQDYILMPLWKDGSLSDSSSKNASNDEPQPSSDARKKDDEGVSQESGIDDQERPESSTQDVNTVGPSITIASTNVNTGRLNINIVSPTVTTTPLKATHANFFGDETELDMSNITTTYLVPTTLNTRIHKYHLLDHVISNVQSGVQTRRMTKTSNEQGFISAIYEGKTHEDLHTCLFSCFLSQVEPKNVIQALTAEYAQMMLETAADDAIQVSTVGLTYYCTVRLKLVQLDYLWHTAIESTLGEMWRVSEIERDCYKDEKVKIVIMAIIEGESMVPQPRSPTQTPVAYEAASTGVDVRLGGATTTVTGLEVGQGSGNIDKTPTMPHDSPLPRVNTLGSDEGTLATEVFYTAEKGDSTAEPVSTCESLKNHCKVFSFILFTVRLSLSLLDESILGTDLL
ncbi:putative ribonuclease H-like domain-containing protein [Tanacetum coccineum]